MTRIAVGAITILAVVACSRAPSTQTPPPPSAAATSAAPATFVSSPEPNPPEPVPLITPATSPDPSSILLTCGGDERFPAAALAGIGLAEFENDAAAAVLKSVIAEAGDPDIFPDHGWHRVAAGPVGVVFVAPGPGDPVWVMVAAVPGPDGWTADLYGACTAQPALPRGIGHADFWLNPDAPPPGPGATKLEGLIVEVSCASAEPPGGRIQPPVVLFDEGSVVITVTVRQRPGAQDCPGNPITPISIELGQPLGDRVVLDGSVFPPRDASVPPG